MSHKNKHHSPGSGLLAAAVAFMAAGMLLTGSSGSVSADLRIDSCGDSDGSRNFYIQGTTVTDGTASVDSCNANDKLVEYFCRDGATDSQIVTCPVNFTCMQGACVQTRFGLTTSVEQSSTGSSLSSASTSSAPVTCADTDGGRDSAVLGTVTKTGRRLTTQQTDRCISGRAVREYYCHGGVAKFVVALCPRGTSCREGVCSR